MAGKKMPVQAMQTEQINEEDEIEILEHRAMVYMPENAVEVMLIAKIYLDSEILRISKKMTMEDIREAFRKADDGYIDEDDRFVMTDKGRAYLEEMCGK